jgi:hypothetical protein
MDTIKWSVRNYLMFNVLSTLRFPLSGIICKKKLNCEVEIVLKIWNIAAQRYYSNKSALTDDDPSRIRNGAM